MLELQALGAKVALPEGVSWVGYESANTITNVGTRNWAAHTSLLSIWIMGMYPANNAITTLVPTKGHNQVCSDYFLPLDTSRLIMKDSVIYFRNDGNYKSKIGVPYPNSKNVIGSYDAKNNLLTVLKFNLPANKVSYLKSSWKLHDQPYEGDVTSSFNSDASHTMYELESSSPALQLAPNERYTHIQQTWHFEGTKQALEVLSMDLLGVSLTRLPWK